MQTGEEQAPAHHRAVLGLPQVLGAPDQVGVAAAQLEVVALDADVVSLQHLRDDHLGGQVLAQVCPGLELALPTSLDPLHGGGGATIRTSGNAWRITSRPK